MIRFQCPRCSAKMEVDESFAGRAARCPTCGTDLRVPKADESGSAITPVGGADKSGATAVVIGGETIKIIPPLDTSAVLSVAFLATSVAAALVIGLGRFVAYPWTIGATIGAGLAVLGGLTAVPAYHNIRRSRGRRRGLLYARIGIFGGAALALVFGAMAVAGWAKHLMMQTTCEENLRAIYGAMRAYADNHDGQLPRSLETLVTDGHLENRDWLTCPGHARKYRVPVGRVTYQRYVAAPGQPEVNLKDPLFPPDLMIISDGAPYNTHKDGMVRALLLDGTIEKVPHRQWQSFVRNWQKMRQEIERKFRERSRPESDGEPKGGGP